MLRIESKTKAFIDPYNKNIAKFNERINFDFTLKEKVQKATISIHSVSQNTVRLLGCCYIDLIEYCKSTAVPRKLSLKILNCGDKYAHLEAIINVFGNEGHRRKSSVMNRDRAKSTKGSSLSRINSDELEFASNKFVTTAQKRVYKINLEKLKDPTQQLNEYKRLLDDLKENEEEVIKSNNEKKVLCFNNMPFNQVLTSEENTLNFNPIEQRLSTNTIKVDHKENEDLTETDKLKSELNMSRMEVVTLKMRAIDDRQKDLRIETLEKKIASCNQNTELQEENKRLSEEIKNYKGEIRKSNYIKEMLQESVKKLKAELNEYKEELGSNSKLINELQASNKETIDRLTVQLNKEGELEEGNKKLKSKMQELVIYCNKFKKEKTTYKSCIEKLNAENERLNTLIKDLQENKNELLLADTTNEQLKNLRIEIQNLKHENSILTNTNKNLLEENSKLSSNLNDTQKRNDELMNDVKSLQRSNTELATTIESLQNDNSRLTHNIEELHIENTKDLVKQLMEDKDKLVNKVNTLQNERDTLINLEADKVNQINELKKNKEILEEELNKERTNCSKLLSELEAKCEMLVDQLKDADDKNSKLLNKQEEDNIVLKSLQDNINKLREENDKLYNQQESNTKNLDLMNKELIEHVKKTDVNEVYLKDQINSLQNRNNILLLENKELIKQQEELKILIKNIQISNKKLEETLNSTNIEKDTCISELKAENKNLADQIKNSINDINTLKNQLKKLNDQKAEDEKNLNELTNKLKNEQSKNEKLHNEIAHNKELEIELKDMEKETIELRYKLTNIQEEHKRTIKDQYIRGFTALMNYLSNRLTTISKFIDDLKKDNGLNKLNENILKLKDLIRQSNKNTEYISEITKLTQKNQDLTASIKKCIQEYKKTQCEVKQLNKEKEELSNSIEELKGEIINLEGINEHLKLHNTELEERIDKQQKHMQVLEESLLNTKQDLAEALNTIQELEAEQTS